MRNILFFFLFFQSSMLFAQPGEVPTVEVNGEKFHVHQVEAGNTLWGLKLMYGVEVDEILKVNPELNEGLKIGQEIHIPFIQPAQIEVTPVEYKVKKGETMYGLSRKFNTTVDRLIELNPELSEGLKKGQKILVPGKPSNDTEPPVLVIEEPIVTPNPFDTDSVKPNDNTEDVKITFSDSTIRHSVLAHETMYSISKRFMVSIETIMKENNLSSTKLKEGQVLIIPVKNERIEKVPIKTVDDIYNPESDDTIVFETKDRYKIAIMVPFFLDYGSGYSKNISSLATQFYMGASMAIDSLKKMGLNADVFFYDTKKDTNAVKSILKKSEFSEMDLIIGPFFSSTQKVVASYCKANKIKMVCPVSSKSSVLENNRLIYTSVPSDVTLIKGLAKYTLENNSGDNILLVKPTKKSDLVLYDAFKSAFDNTPIPNGNARPRLIETDISNMKLFIKRGQKTIFILPTNDRNTAMKFMNSLNRSSFRSKADDMFVYGTKEWVNFSDINNTYKNDYNFHYAGPNFIDYYSDEMMLMNETYRDLYKTDLAKMAVQGYDVMLYYSSLFFMNNSNVNLLMNNFNTDQVSDSDGFENTEVFIIRQEDYELINAEIIIE